MPRKKENQNMFILALINRSRILGVIEMRDKDEISI
jgi:hypothetical protein